ncbi:Uncharacterised protein [Bartonella vinsonii]|uniref:Uncharacterized protein n=1 Tax=Bartonella vinsonii TaxID=33047 RepID=A0A3S4Z4Q6_BARVI|nr:Uncharacterised protein [Bartonella vinsonii]
MKVYQIDFISEDFPNLPSNLLGFFLTLRVVSKNADILAGDKKL